MELKKYQKRVMKDLSSYLECVDTENNILTAWNKYWNNQDVRIGMGGVPLYKNTITGVPNICMKVPTGGGKTFMACSSIKYIYRTMPINQSKVVVWLVPSDAILTQTIDTLTNINHPYRQKLDADFSGRVGVYTKDMLLNGQNFSPDTVKEMLTVCVLSYASLRINSKNKEVRKVYQENGNLLNFSKYFEDKEVLLADTPDTALIQVLRQLSPVVVVDESHNAGSDLSVEMLNNLNPTLVLDLTATPRNNSNIISYVDARELKKENMVKLPVIVYNRTKKEDVINDAVHLRAQLERQAILDEENGGEYIRPIVLFQAQPKTNDDSETFDRIKKMLIDNGINEEEIAIKTSKINELKNINLLSKSCKIRYIITVNALKEGWDCPFAYILASLANKTSKVDVEQILGRILRQPYAKKHNSSLLNTSYVLTSSNDFRSTLENIVSALNQAGFSKKDFRLGEDIEPIINSTDTIQATQITIDEATTENNSSDYFDDLNFEDINLSVDYDTEINVHQSDAVQEMVKSAVAQAEEYDEVSQEDELSNFTKGELGNMMNQNCIQEQFLSSVSDIKIPQFFLKTAPNLFSDGLEILEPKNLSEGFSLLSQDANISFELATGEMFRVDVEDQGEAVPKYKKISNLEGEYIRKMLKKLPHEEKLKKCAEMICKHLNNNDQYLASDVYDYVHRVISNMSEDELSAMETAISTYSTKILKKIKVLEGIHREKEFYKWLDTGKIECAESYVFPKVITPVYTTDSIPNSLYEAEKADMNDFEHKVINAIVATDNIKWWHRNIERSGFNINGPINHYPDFIVMTKSGKLLLVESKGDHLDGSDSEIKLKLGQKWKAYAGNNYRYFMVFETKGIEDAYNLDGFIEIMKSI